MATVSMKNDMRELTMFLEGDYINLGHPGPSEDDGLTALTKALEDVVADTQVQNALDEIKAALREGGWLRPVLEEHVQTYASFRRALELCVCICETLRFVTSDSAVPEKPVYGKWQPIDNPDTDPIMQELDLYCVFTRDLPTYMMFVENVLLVASLDRRLPPTCQVAVDTLNLEIAKFPRWSQLLGAVYKLDPPPRGEYAWYSWTSYSVFSTTDSFSRSWLLANLTHFIQELNNCKQLFTDAMPESNRAEHDRRYNKLLAAYESWRTLASSKMSVPFTQLQKREYNGNGNQCGGPNKRHQSTMLQLLDELQKCM